MKFFRSLPLCSHQLLLPLLVSVLAISAYFFSDLFGELFIYQRDKVIDFQLWRLFTSHFFHTNVAHLLLNLSAVVLLWALHGQFYTYKNYSLLLLTCALTSSIGIYFDSPELHQYVGLSGVLHGLFVWGALKDIQHKDKTGYLLFVGVWIKIAHEQIFGASNDVAALINASVAVDAHLWGAVGGLFIGFVSFLMLAKQQVSSSQSH
ncbi:rhombosortase [Colwelliaceae bacterium 6471]